MLQIYYVQNKYSDLMKIRWFCDQCILKEDYT